jgi:predicted NBD/HSP70 family sugar kinase
VVHARVRHQVDHIVSVDECIAIVRQVLESMTTTHLVGHRVFGIGLAIPGLVWAADGSVRFAPHLGWTDQPIAHMLKGAVGIPVVVGNDASLGAVAELVFGAGRGVNDLVYLNGGAYSTLSDLTLLTNKNWQTR